MQKSLLITGVRVIPANAKVARPLVIFSVNEPNGAKHEDIVLAPTQAIIGLQNSARVGTDIDPLSLTAVRAFKACEGAVLKADITYHKAGEFYVIDSTHPAITGKTPHALAGQVKIGDKIAYEQDGLRIEGFIDVPFTKQEQMLEMTSNRLAESYMSMFGMTAFAVPSAVATSVEDDVPETTKEPITASEEEAFGTPTKTGKAK